MRRTRTIIVVLCLCLVGFANGELTIDELVEEAGIVEGPVAMRDIDGWRGAKKILAMRVGEDDASALRTALPGTQIVVAAGLEDAIRQAADVDAIVGSCNKRLIDAAARLVWVQIWWAGAERCLAVPRIGNGEIVLTNMQKMSAPVIGAHTVALALARA